MEAEGAIVRNGEIPTQRVHLAFENALFLSKSESFPAKYSRQKGIIQVARLQTGAALAGNSTIKAILFAVYSLFIRLRKPQLTASGTSETLTTWND